MLGYIDKNYLAYLYVQIFTRIRRLRRSVTMASAIAGQGALRLLPSSPYSVEHSVASYELPSKLKAERRSLKDATASGISIDVLKVSKVR